jgi:hypothetical protein
MCAGIAALGLPFLALARRRTAPGEASGRALRPRRSRREAGLSKSRFGLRRLVEAADSATIW